jgi:lysozyme
MGDSTITIPTNDDDFNKLLVQLRRDEGLRLALYVDTTGNATIGYGHKVTQTSTKIATCTKEQAEAMLADDAWHACLMLSSYLPWTNDLDSARQGVLRNMMFNLGPGGLLGFHHMLSAMHQKLWRLAAESMDDSLWARQTGERESRLRRQVLSGDWQ